MMGFTSSPNSYAAVLVLLMLVAAGVAVQRVADGDAAWAPRPPAAILAAVVSHSPAVAPPSPPPSWAPQSSPLWRSCGPLAPPDGIRRRRGRRRYHCRRGRRPRPAPRNALPREPHLPLALLGGRRQIVRRPPARGGRLGQFRRGITSPTACRSPRRRSRTAQLPRCSFATELGAVGLALVVGWLLTLWWELTQRRLPTADAETVADDGEAVRPDPALLGTAGVGGLVMSSRRHRLGAARPPRRGLEVMRRIGFLCLFMVGSAAGGAAVVRAAGGPTTAPPRGCCTPRSWPSACSSSTTWSTSPCSSRDPMFLFAWLCGSALGTRQIDGSIGPRARRASSRRVVCPRRRRVGDRRWRLRTSHRTG